MSREAPVDAAATTFGVEPLVRVAADGDPLRAVALGECFVAVAQAGFTRVWFEVEAAPAGEVHRASLADPFHVAVASSADAPGLTRVALGLRLPRARAWLRFAEDAATADGILSGRLELGLAAVPGARLCAQLRAAWSAERVFVDAATQVEVHPQPARRGGPPLWARARSAADLEALEAAGVAALVEDVGLARMPSGSSPRALRIDASDDTLAARALRDRVGRVRAGLPAACGLVVDIGAPGAASAALPALVAARDGG